MKKVISINLGSVVFAIEQDAYDALAAYLEEIKTNLANTEDAGEVVADVERAIAEKFIAKKRSEKSAVTSADVEQIMREMGSPADFGEVSSENNASESASTTSGSAAGASSTSDAKRRLYRDTDDAVIAGVASGLAQYFGIDPVIVRLIFVVSIFFNGFGILAYIILWLVVPAATTTTDKYAMRGERVTLRDISERVKKNIDSIDEKDLETAKGAWAKVRGVLEVCFTGLGKVFRVLASLSRFLSGILLIVTGAFGIAGLVSLYSVILLSEKVFFPYDVQVALDVLTSSTLGIVAMVSSFLVMMIPLIVCIMAGSSLIAKRSHFTVQKSVTLAVVWIVAVVVAGTTSALQVEQVMQRMGPIQGRFNDSQFEVQWNNGFIHGNGDFIQIHYDDSNARFSNTEVAADYRDAAYMIEGNRVTLTDGYNESEIAPGSASKIITRYFGNELVTDLDGDGDDDVAFILTQETGGSGVFYYAVAALNTERGYIGSDGYLLGDRIAPQSTNVSQNPRHRNVVVFNYADRATDEPKTTQPSMGESVYLKLVPGTIQWAIVEPDFEGESAF